MKRSIILALILLLAQLPSVAIGAAGSSRFALDQKWRKIEEWQKREADRFKKLESDAARGIESVTEPRVPKGAVHQFR